jgi:DNA-binding NarL/FixJ family response regulator
VAILDIGMPLLNGIEATRQIVRRVPLARVLILGMHTDQNTVRTSSRSWGCATPPSSCCTPSAAA